MVLLVASCSFAERRDLLGLKYRVSSANRSSLVERPFRRQVQPEPETWPGMLAGQPGTFLWRLYRSLQAHLRCRRWKSQVVYLLCGPVPMRLLRTEAKLLTA